MSDPTPAADAPPASPSKPPPAPTHAVVQAIDHLGEIVAVAIAGYLCAHGRMSAEAFMLYTGTVLGVQTGIRNVAKVKGAQASGVLGLAFAVVGSAALHRVIAGGTLLALAVALGGCPWRNATSDCTTAGSWECVDNRPHRCMSNRVLRPTRPACGAGEACALTPGLFGAAVAACAPNDANATDAARDAAGDAHD